MSAISVDAAATSSETCMLVQIGAAFHTSMKLPKFQCFGRNVVGDAVSSRAGLSAVRNISRYGARNTNATRYPTAVRSTTRARPGATGPRAARQEAVVRAT